MEFFLKQNEEDKRVSEIIKKVELNYRKSDGTITPKLDAVESFRGHTATGRHFVGAYIHTYESGAFHLFEVFFLENMFQIAEFKYDNYITATLTELENTCCAFTDSTFVLDEAADNLSIFLNYIENGC